MAKRRGVRCSVKDCWHKAEYVCDARVIDATFGSVACDAELCRYHAKLVRFGVHHCPDHTRERTEEKRP